MNNNNKTIIKSTYTIDKVIIIVGILGLLYIIIYIYNNYNKIIDSVLPTVTNGTLGATCPDYWDSIGDVKCKNTNKIGICSKIDGADVMDFNSDVFTNVNSGNYAKCKWAKGCNVSWGSIDRLC